MNTLIYIWIEPLVIGNKKADNTKLYFEYITSENVSGEDAENFISGSRLSDIMDFADVSQNWDYGVISASPTEEKPCIRFTTSPEERKLNEKISDFINSDKDIVLQKKDFEIDGGLVKITYGDLQVNEQFDFLNFWRDFIEKNLVGKIKEGDSISIKDEHGNEVIEIRGGGFLNACLADININRGDEQIGGMFIRDGGFMDIGDVERTFYIRINTNKLIKICLKNKKSLTDSIKLSYNNIKINP